MPPRHGLLPLLPVHKSGPQIPQMRLLLRQGGCPGPVCVSKCHLSGPPTPPLYRDTSHSSGGWPCPRGAAEVKELALALCSPTVKGGATLTFLLPAQNLVVLTAPFLMSTPPCPWLGISSKPPVSKPLAHTGCVLASGSAYCHLSKNFPPSLKGRDLKILTAINSPAGPCQSTESWHGCLKV